MEDINRHINKIFKSVFKINTHCDISYEINMTLKQGTVSILLRKQELLNSNRKRQVKPNHLKKAKSISVNRIYRLSINLYNRGIFCCARNTRLLVDYATYITVTRTAYVFC